MFRQHSQASTLLSELICFLPALRLLPRLQMIKGQVCLSQDSPVPCPLQWLSSMSFWLCCHGDTSQPHMLLHQGLKRISPGLDQFPSTLLLLCHQKDADRMILLTIPRSRHLIPQHHLWLLVTYSKPWRPQAPWAIVQPHHQPLLGSPCASCTWFCFFLYLFFPVSWNAMLHIN